MLKKTNELVDFIECNEGREALRVLGGVRINMSPEYKAEEDIIEDKKYKQLKGG